MPIYWALLTYILLKPSKKNIEYWVPFLEIDKIVHFILFAILGFLFKSSIPKTKFPLFFIILFVYSVCTEIAQHAMKMGRTGDLYDLLADVLGYSAGYYLYQKIIKKA